MGAGMGVTISRKGDSLNPAELKAISERASEAVQVWSLTQFYSVDFSKSRNDVKKCVFNKHTIKVCVSCC